MISLAHRRRVAWFAVFAVLLNALAPAMSHALAARLGVTWLEICTKDGLKRIAVNYQGARPDLPAGAHVAAPDHCPYCAPHGASVAHVPPAGAIVPVVTGPALVAAVLTTRAPQRAEWSSGHARAPPAFS